MHTDEQYGQHLGLQLRHELAPLQAAPDLVRQLRRRQTRRTWGLVTAIATPVAAAAVAVALAAGGPGAARPADNTARLQDVAYVQAQTVNALGQASRYVIHAKTSYAGGFYEEWIDKTTQRYRNDLYGSTGPANPVGPDGKAQAPPAPDQIGLGSIHLMQSHSATGPSGNQDLVTVDYDLKVWWTEHVSDPKPVSAVPDPTDPDAMQKAVANGTVQLLGHETVGGVDTLHLRLFAVQRGYRLDLWVDARTFLPIAETATVISASTDEASVRTEYTWLPRTSGNLAHLVLTPPPGFQRR